MAIRINRAKNFAGKNYIVTTEIQQLLSGLALNNNLVLSLGSGYSFDDDTSITAPSIDLTPVKNAAVSAVVPANMTANQIVLANAAQSIKTTGITIDSATTLGGDGASDTKLATQKAVKDYVDDHAVNVVAGAGIAIDTTTATAPKVSADVDGTTIVLSGSGDSAKLASNLTIKKKADPNTGYAASYYLAYGDSTTPIGGYIDLLKDQFLKNVKFIASATASDVTAAGENPGFTAGDPVLKFTFELTGTSDDTDSVLYVPVKGLVDVYTPGNGIGITSNVVSAIADTSDKIYTAKGTQASVMSVGANGIKATGIQAAIDLAVDNEHAKASAAVAGLNSRIDDLKTKAENAIDALDSAVDVEIASVESNVGTALTGTVSSVNTKVNSAVGNVNTNVGTAVTALNGKVDAAVTAVNGAIGSSVSAVNGAVSSAVSDVNGKVSAAVTKAVELEETTYTFGTAPATVTSGVATITGVTGNVLAVFDTTGAQVYPDIVKTGAGTEATNTLSADYGTENTTGLKWVVLHTKAIAYTNAAYSNATASSATAPAAVSYTNAGSATNAVATAVAPTETTGTVDIAAIASAVTIGALDYMTK